MSAPSLEAPADVARAEIDLLAQESKVTSEMARLLAEAERVQGRIRGLQVSLQQLASDGGGEGLSRPIQSLGVPSLELGKAVREAHQARAAAVKARLRALEETRSLTTAFTAELSRVSEAIDTHTQDVASEQKELQVQRQRRAMPPPPPRDAVPPRLEPRESRARKGRVKMQAAIDLRSDSNFFTGFSTNLSEGGVFVATVSLLPLGSEVELRFTLPSGQAVDVHGVVRWTREVNDRTPDVFPGMGVQFQDLPAAAAEAIRQFVATREPLFFPD